MKAHSNAHKPRPRFKSRASKQMFLQFIYISMSLALFVVLVTITLDPLQFYRKATLYTPIFSNEQRYQNPGLALHYDYDTIIIGTSMTENFLPSEVDRAMGGQALKLSMRGSTVDEQFQIAALALQTGKVKNVIWGIDYFALKKSEQVDSSTFPHYLYDDNPWNDFNYWMNYSVYEQFAIGIGKRLLGTAPADVEHLYNWNSKVNFGDNHVLHAYEEARYIENQFEQNEEPLSIVKNNFNLFILDLVKQYPEVNFHFYYPPYSILRHSVWKDTNLNRFEYQLEMKEWMFEQFVPYGNTRIFDFQTKSEWTYDLAHYTDLSHHNQDVNTWIAQAIGRLDEQYLVTEDNVSSFREQLEQQVESVFITEDRKVMSAEVILLKEQAAPLTFSRRWMASSGDLLVPARELSQSLGATMKWDPETKEITLAIEEKVVKLTLGSNEMNVNNLLVDIAHPAITKNNATLIPLQSTATGLGFMVTKENKDAFFTRYIIE